MSVLQAYPASVKQSLLQRVTGLALLLSALACSANSPGSPDSAPGTAGTHSACRNFMHTLPPDILAPRVLERVAPEPTLGGTSSGYACLQSTLTIEGRIVDTKIVDTNNMNFAGAAVRALAQWRYSPATRDGVPVEIPISYSFSYARGY